MKQKLSGERIIAIAMILFALIILYECVGMKFTAPYSLGPAAAPVICAILLIFFSIMVWITSAGKAPVNWNALKTENGKRAVLLITFTFAFILGMYFAGLWIPLLLFSILSFWKIENHPIGKSIIMSIAWVAFLYVVFVILLKMNIPLFK